MYVFSTLQILFANMVTSSSGPSSPFATHARTAAAHGALPGGSCKDRFSGGWSAWCADTIRPPCIAVSAVDLGVTSGCVPRVNFVRIDTLRCTNETHVASLSSLYAACTDASADAELAAERLLNRMTFFALGFARPNLTA